MIAIDTETYLIRGKNIPPIICVSYARMNGAEWDAGVVRGEDAYKLLETALSGDEHIVFHNARFDLCVIGRAWRSLIPLIYTALAQDRIHDTKIREKLHKIAQGGSGSGILRTDHGNRLPKLSLAGLAWKYLNIDLSADKSAGSVRYRYDELAELPLSEWDSEAIEYATQDAIITGLVYHCQRDIDPDELHDECAQVRADYVLGVMGAEGVTVDAESVETVADALRAECDEIAIRIKRAGYMDARGKLNTSAIKDRIDELLTEQGIDVPKTDTGEVSMNREALTLTNDPDLMDIDAFKQSQKLLSTYIGDLESARAYDDILRAEYNVLMVTGRTSCKNPNLQNLPRRGGIRDCFVPRTDCVFVLCDYDAVEMRTLAQCFLDLTGESTPLAEMYAQDSQFDPHAYFGAKLLNIDYETMLKRLQEGDSEAKSIRQRAKPANFGYAGGMGAGAFIGYARGYGIELTESEAQELRDQWINTYNMRPWFKQAERAHAEGRVICPSSKRVRGRPSYTESANMPFQGMASDGAKRALFAVSRECYADPNSVLFGSRPLVFVHDEIILEAPAHRAHECAMRLKELMEQEMRVVTPSIPASATPAIATRWLKGAEPVYDDNDRLIPWG